MKINKINLIILILVILIPIFLTGWLYQGPPIGIKKPSAQIPDISFTARDGRTYSLRDFDGNFVMVNLWASWCAPCVVEFPHLMTLAKSHPDTLKIIALSSDFGESEMERFLKKFDREIPPNMIIALDPQGQTTREIFQTYQLPESFIYGPDGGLRKKIVGIDWTVQELGALLR